MNRSPQHRAAADPVTLGLVALIALAAGVFGTSWKPLEVFRPKPPVEELTKLQGQLATAQTAAEQARKEKDAAVAAERAKLESQIRSAQEDNAGTQAALAVAPSGPEVKLAKEMAVRVDLKLAAAIGDLPKANREAMLKLIADALAGKDQEFRDAMAKRDAEFAIIVRERDALKEQIPVLVTKAAKAEETVKAVQTEVTKKTDEVKTIAKDLDEERRQKSSFKAAAEKAFNWALWIAGIWAFVTFVLPGIVKHMPEGHPLKTFLRAFAGLTTSPLLYLDASAKINELKRQTTAPFQP